MAARKINFTFKINQTIRTGDIALLDTHWTASWLLWMQLKLHGVSQTERGAG